METILLIEDNSNILDNLTEYLELEGFNILIAKDGRKGIEIAHEQIPDLILCDILMPDMNGIEVLHSVIDSPVTNKIPFIFSTAKSETTDRTEALKLGADDYIVKPYEMDTLLNMIQYRIKTGTSRNLIK